MLKNIPVSKMIEILLKIQKESSMCDIQIDETGSVPKISFRPVRDPTAIVNKVDFEIPKEAYKKLDKDDLDKLIV